MSPRIYVAAAFSERLTRARPAMDRIRALGGAVTHDWTADPPPGVTTDADLTDAQRVQLALADYRGVAEADVVWLLAPTDKGSCGAWVEFGAAIALGKRTVVSGPASRRSIFTEMATRRFETDTEALVWINDGRWL